jgi:signal transduction histidine kinase
MDEGTGAERPVFDGHAALRRLGIRVTWMYLVAGALALGVEAVGDPPPTTARRLGLLGVLAVLAATGGSMTAACRRPGSRFWAAATMLVNTVAGVALVVQVAHDPGWISASLLGTTVTTGASIGLALGVGPGAGLLAAGLATVAMSLAGSGVGIPIGMLELAGLPTSAAVAACIALLTGRGFAETERALQGVDEALAMQRVAAARWQARRRADRDLHDTVLTTLTVLAHDQFGFDPEPVRELCRRDLAFVSRDAWRVTTPVTTLEESARAVLPSEAFEHWSAAGLRVHRYGLEPAEPLWMAGLGADAASAVLAAVEECLSNVARHAGVDVAEVVINRQADDLVALVVDRGRGFDPEQVPDDRLGLAESVRGRILDLGGSVTLWSRPGVGTTVMLTVPVRGG